MSGAIKNSEYVKQIIEIAVKDKLNKELRVDYAVEGLYTLDATCIESNTRLAKELGKDLLSFALIRNADPEQIFTANFNSRDAAGVIAPGLIMTYSRGFIREVYSVVLNEQNTVNI